MDFTCNDRNIGIKVELIYVITFIILCLQITEYSFCGILRRKKM